MQPSDRQPFADLLAEVMAYYNRDTSPFVLDVFWAGLRQHEFADVSRAFSLHARDPDHGQFAPRVADLTRLLEGSTQTQGMRAWAKVDRAIRSVGQYQSVAFDDPLIHAVVDEMGGWPSLCRCKADEIPFRAREFERRYAAYRLRREAPAFPPHLIGLCESENRMHGFEIDSRPVLIGDPDKAVRVMERGKAQPSLQITYAGQLAQKALTKLSRKDAV